MSDDKRRILLISLIAVVLALMGFIYASIPQDVAFEIVKNNTDLCNFNHTSLLCNGIRQNNVTYYTNDTAIILYVFAHANAVSQTAGIFMYRDNTLIEAQGGRPLAAPEETWRGVTAIIPKNSSYRVNITNFHHFEWREDKILSGRNGTLSINNTYNNYTNITGGGCTGDCSFNNLSINSLGVNDSSLYLGRINLKSGFVNTSSTGNDSSMELRGDGFFITTENATGYHGLINGTTTSLLFEVTNDNVNWIEMLEQQTRFRFNLRNYIMNESGFDLDGANLTNCSNCGGNQNLNQVLAVGNDANQQRIQNASFITMKNAGTSGFDVQNTGASVVNSLAVGAIGNMNLYGNWNSTSNNVSNSTYPVWAFRFGVAGTQLNKLRFIYIAPGNPNYGNAIAGDTGETAMEIYMNKSVNISVGTDLLLKNLTGAGNVYLCIDANGKVFRGSPGC